ncbi:MAG: choice-of-anchor Q domain-containing protein [Phycisphaerales bacterium]
MLRLSAISTMLLLAGTALGQSVNIDLNFTGKTIPSASYGAAAGQPGTWNQVVATGGAGASSSLVGLNGLSSGLTILAKTNSGNHNGDLGSGDFGSLMDDYAMGFDTNGVVTIEISGLDEGFYRAFAYASLTPADQTYVDGFGFTNYHNSYLSGDVGGLGFGSGSTSGPTVPDTFQYGKTHVVFNFTVGAGAPKLKLTSSCDFVSLAKCAFNGLQLVKITGSRLYVNDNAAGLNNGMSWTNAFNSLQEALSVARASGGQITEIWVAGGLYNPGQNRIASFKLVNNVKMYGGFVGNETLLTQRVLSVGNQSYLSGEIGTGLANDNCYHVVDGSNVSYLTELDGFTIASGYANSTAPNEIGGGMYIADGSPTVRNCTFFGNTALHGGGGVAIDGTTALIGPHFDHCIFSQNHADEGGALQYFGGPGGFLQPVLSIDNCKFVDNDASSHAGAIRAYGDTYITNCAIWGNSAPQDGGAVYISGANVDLVVRSSTIVGNLSTSGAGGLRALAGANIDMRNSIAYYNTGPGLMIPTVKQVNASGGTSSVGYSCVNGDFFNTPISGVGNIAAAPSFVNYSGSDGIPGNLDDDFHLNTGSPCVDTGTNAEAVGLTKDIEDLTRIIDGDNSGNARIDMGAFELQHAPCPCDLNGDGQVDDADFTLFVSAYNKLDCADPLMPAGCPADFDGNNLVDDADFVIFVAAYNELLCP